MKINKWFKASLSAAIVVFISMASSVVFADESVSSIIESIKDLEKNKDPKCYATASRLEDFMFGTPLSDTARFKKNVLQKRWVEKIWQEASTAELEAGYVTSAVIKKTVEKHFKYQQNKHWTVSFKDNRELNINKDDKRQYSNVAYSLRAILAIQQESIMDVDSALAPLSKSAVAEFKTALDLLNLSVLKVSDALARESDVYEVSDDLIDRVWVELVGASPVQKASKQLAASDAVLDKSNKLIESIVKQKIDSYKIYNDISNQLFVRNLQVYFSRLSWSKDPAEAKEFKDLFVETMIQFSSDIYKQSEALALSNNRTLISELDVKNVIDKFIPHHVNDYEDVVFFPKLPGTEKITIEAYDLDSFRDSGNHWRYLGYAIGDKNFDMKLQADPFALELLVENIAQFGVLSLRVAGMLAKEDGHKILTKPLYVNGLKSIQNKIHAHLKVKDVVEPEAALFSVEAANKPLSQGNKFTDVTQALNVDIMHRTSSWLNRLLRSYLEKSEEVGIITIPPAFGGGGIAAEDVNNDGLIDLLILSGLGNKLYLNQSGEKFVDVTEQSGLTWNRPDDKRPGEPRQPLIADLDNDGLQDIVITYVDDNHRVYKNIGNAKFVDVTKKSALGGKDLVGGPATVADFDNDGLLDIYITYFGHYTKGVLPTLKRRNVNGLPNQLFKNMGDFTFKNITKGSGVDNAGWGQAVSHTDLNNDGLQDLIVGNDFGVNSYYLNKGGNKFEDIAGAIGTDKPSYTMNIGISDLNQDLVPDIYISNIVTMNKDEKYVLPSEDTVMKFNAEKLAKMRVVEANDLFLSGKSESGGVKYSLSKVVGRGYSSTGWAWDADFFDFDNDGDNDLYVLNGMNEFNLYSSDNPYYEDPIKNQKANVYIPVSDKERNVFFINSQGKLENSSKISGLDFSGNSRSAAYLDYDNDGDLDIAVNNYHEKANIFRNNLAADDSNWIKIKLIGSEKQQVNRDAIGAKLILTTTLGHKLWREIHGSEGYMSVHPKLQHFGLGDAKIKSLKVVWPNGVEQVFSGLVKNKTYTITIGSSPVVIAGGSKL